MNYLKLILITCVFTCTGLDAQTKLASIFGDHMVLQRHSNVKVWGTDKPNIEVEVSGSWGADSKTKTDHKGKWATTLKTDKAGGPYTLEVRGSSKVEVNDVLLGEVWLCGGQSNMAMKLKGGPGQHIEDSNDMILNSKNPNLRFFTVKKNISEIPVENCEGTWQISQPKTAVDFRAVGYSFGLKLQKFLNVPVGLISSNVGATPAQAWTSREVIASEFPEFKTDFSKKYTHKSA